jgi:hypothetical protein
MGKAEAEIVVPAAGRVVGAVRDARTPRKVAPTAACEGFENLFHIICFFATNYTNLHEKISVNWCN